MSVTDDPSDPDLTRGSDEIPVQMADKYLVLPKAERQQGFLRSVRRTYIHQVCGAATTMGQAIAETYARNPQFYGSTWCVVCSKHRPVGPDGEFVWEDGSKVGT